MNVMVDLRESVPKVKETFNGVDFATLQDLLDKFEDLVYELARKEEEIGYKHLEDLAYILVPLKNLENDIDSAIISEDEMFEVVDLIGGEYPHCNSR